MTQKHKTIPGVLACVLYKYDPETGHIYNRKNGKRIGWKSPKGYANVTLQCDSKRVGNYRVNRLAWAMFTGIDPGELEVDHDNNNRDDNSINNLQPMRPSKNRFKRSISSATPGVSRDKSYAPKPWRAHFEKGKIKTQGPRRKCPLIARMDREELEERYK